MKTRREIVLSTLATLTVAPVLASEAIHLESDQPIRPTFNKMIEYLAKCTKRTGEMPTVALMGMGAWVILVESFTPDDTYQSGDGYLAVDIAGIPFCCVAAIPDDTMFLLHPTNQKACGKFTGLEHLDI